MVYHNQVDDDQPEIKNLSEQSKSLLSELEAIPMKYINLATALYDSLTHNDGLEPKDARKLIQERVQISYRTLMRALPQEAKQVHKKFAKMSNFNKSDKMSQLKSLVLPVAHQIQEPETEPKEESVEKIEQEYLRDTQPQPVQPSVQPQPEPLKRKHEEALIPFPLAEQLNKFLLARLIGMARGQGDPGVRIKINDQGEVYLP